MDKSQPSTSGAFSFAIGDNEPVSNEDLPLVDVPTADPEAAEPEAVEPEAAQPEPAQPEREPEPALVVSSDVWVFRVAVVLIVLGLLLVAWAFITNQ